MNWKEGIVTPIHKAENRHQPKNYRPITITSILCRLLEKTIKRHVMEHLLENDLIPPEQHGFMPGKSCLTNLLETMEDITKWCDMGIPVDEVFLDFSKAFDKVPHQRLLYKLHKLGINENVLCWIESFLCNRTQRVRIRSSLSKQMPVDSGVPQGSVLGPLLFIAYIIDLPCQVKSSATIFAEDTKLYKKTETVQDANDLQNDLDTLTQWCEEWGMIFNRDKCCVMHYGYHNKRYIYHISGRLLTPCATHKDLGVIISDTLKPAEQISKCVTKANTMVGLIKRTFSHMDKDIFMATYKVFVRPILGYCQQVWSPYYVKDIEQLEQVQRRATKLVPELKDMEYEDRVKALGLFTLSQRRVRGDMIFMFKIFNNLVNIDHTKMFQKSTENRTRGHTLKLSNHRSNGDIRQYFYCNRVIVPWNNLPSHVIHSENVSQFKRNYDKFIMSQNNL